MGRRGRMGLGGKISPQENAGSAKRRGSSATTWNMANRWHRFHRGEGGDTQRQTKETKGKGNDYAACGIRSRRVVSGELVQVVDFRRISDERVFCHKWRWEGLRV